MPDKCFYDVSKLSKHDVTEYPAFFAEFYDIIYSKVRGISDVEYYLGLIGKSGGKILEIGAGTGRIMAEAFEKGADIYGIDTSPAMIDVLRSKLPDKEQNRVFLKDARYMNLGMEFDLIIAPFRMFQHIHETDDQIVLLNNVYTHLKPGGRFVFDVFVPNQKFILDGIDDAVTFEGEYEPGKNLIVKASSHSDTARQISNISVSVQWDDAEGAQNMKWNSKIRYFYRYELENLVRLSKLRLVNIYGDFSGNEISDKSEDFVIVCEKDLLRL
jgi:SAM-dependent methyltransferase